MNDLSGKFGSSDRAYLDRQIDLHPPVDPCLEVVFTFVPIKENCFLCLPITPTTTPPT